MSEAHFERLKPQIVRNKTQNHLGSGVLIRFELFDPIQESSFLRIAEADKSNSEHIDNPTAS